MSAATETVIELLCRADVKRGGLFIVKRATGTELAARTLQGDTLIDQICDIGSRYQLVDKLFGNSRHLNLTGNVA
mgnify:CR=1 FL=1